ncbi:MAG: hypothetical protein A3F68_02865 [Acidobacteria bacterium RIFCSPLOWO2_12_FULL_54_10]|nr:MAG: hypothetical protein A3F68_02865 [Acidobacteria bacterium RIFCSPLOWO2_12_FULL_54_10]
MSDLKEAEIKTLRIACQALGRKWTFQVLGELCRQPLRFNELQQRLPWISGRSLGRVLHHLENAGVIDRRVNDNRPPNVIYSIPTGDVLLREIIGLLARWGSQRSGKLAPPGKVPGEDNRR